MNILVLDLLRRSKSYFDISGAVAVILSTIEALVVNMPPVRRQFPLIKIVKIVKLVQLTWSEVKDRWKWPTIRKACIWISQLIKVWVK